MTSGRWYGQHPKLALKQRSFTQWGKVIASVSRKEEIMAGSMEEVLAM